MGSLVRRCSLAISLLGIALSVSGAPADRNAVPLGRVVTGASMESPRSLHLAVLLPDGRVLIAGGMVANGNLLDSAEIYDPSSLRFTPAGHMLSRRTGASAVLLRNGKVLITGGWASQTPAGVQASAELFDPRTREFTSAGKMTSPRADATAVLLSDGTVLILGGCIGDDDILASAEIYDPQKGTFTPTGSMNDARIPYGAVLLRNGRVLVAGGTGSGREVLASAEEYDPARGKWTRVGPLRTPRNKHALTLLGDGRVLVAGGSDNRGWRGQLTSAEIYDPQKREFSVTGALQNSRFKLPQATVLLPNGNVLVAGGSRIVESYDPHCECFHAVNGELDDAHYFASATRLRDGRVLIAGGYDAGGHPGGPQATARTWLYQP